MLDKEEHRQVMVKILLQLISNKRLVTKLGFKGGTMLYLFDGLDRFSTDLDFDLIGDGSKEEFAMIDEIVKRNLKVNDSRAKRFTWFWQGSYKKGFNKIKVEVNLRDYGSEYEIREYYGYSMLVMKPEYLLAHKLCAVLDRKKLQNRDLYDVWWMLNKGYKVKKRVVEERMGVKMNDYWLKLLKLVRDLPDNYDVLSGLGEVVGESKKDWIKAKLLSELELELASRVS